MYRCTKETCARPSTFLAAISAKSCLAISSARKDMSKETHKRDLQHRLYLQKRPMWINRELLGHLVCAQTHVKRDPQNTCQKRLTHTTYKRDLQKRPTKKVLHAKETCKTDLHDSAKKKSDILSARKHLSKNYTTDSQKRPAKETYTILKETCKTDLHEAILSARKHLSKETYTRDL